jgi:hypothetical protein
MWGGGSLFEPSALFWSTCPSGRRFEALSGKTSPGRLFFTMSSLIDDRLTFCIFFMEEEDLRSAGPTQEPDQPNQ